MTDDRKPNHDYNNISTTVEIEASENHMDLQMTAFSIAFGISVNISFVFIQTKQFICLHLLTQNTA